MKLSIKVFGEDGKRIKVPMSIFRMKDWMLPQIGNLMHVFAISEVHLVVKTASLFPTFTLDYATFSSDLPQIMHDIRTDVLAAIKTLMITFGYQSITLTINDTELEQLRMYWGYIEDGSASIGDDPQLMVPMPIIEDPLQLPIKLPDILRKKEDIK